MAAAKTGAGAARLSALGAAGVSLPATAFAQDDAWRPRTVPLFGASYSPDVGLLLGAGLLHTRYGFRALPPSTRLLVSTEYATSAPHLSRGRRRRVSAAARSVDPRHRAARVRA